MDGNAGHAVAVTNQTSRCFLYFSPIMRNVLKQNDFEMAADGETVEKCSPGVARSRGFDSASWMDEAAAGLQIEVGRPAPARRKSLRARSEGPEGRSVTWPLAPAFTQLAAETHRGRLSSAPLPPVDRRRLQRAAAAALPQTERLSEKYDKDFCFPPPTPPIPSRSPQPRAIDRR